MKLNRIASVPLPTGDLSYLRKGDRVGFDKNLSGVVVDVLPELVVVEEADGCVSTIFAQEAESRVLSLRAPEVSAHPATFDAGLRLLEAHPAYRVGVALLERARVAASSADSLPEDVIAPAVWALKALVRAFRSHETVFAHRVACMVADRYVLGSVGGEELDELVAALRVAGERTAPSSEESDTWLVVDGEEGALGTVEAELRGYAEGIARKAFGRSGLTMRRLFADEVGRV